MKFDELLSRHLGDFGRYQQVVYLITCLPPIWCAISIYSWTFVGVDVPFRCRLSDSEEFGNESATGDWVQPEQTAYAQCYRQHAGNGSLQRCTDGQGYVWDNSQFLTSAVQDWELVCERSWLKAACQSVLYAGIGVGSLLLGWLANKYGRKPVIVVGALCITVLSTAATWSTNVYMFMALRFLIGVAEPSLWQTPFCACVEIVGPPKRMVSGMVIELFFTAGMVLLAVLGYFIRTWKTLQFVTSVPGIVFVSYFWIFPESPRWLLSMGRREEALDNIRQMARVNGVALSDELLATLNEDDEVMTEEKQPLADGTEETLQHQQQRVQHTYGYLDLFKTPNMARKTTICLFTWITVVLIYYAISLNPSAIGGDFYSAFMLGSLVEAPAVLFLLLTLNVLGRKLLQASGFILSGVALVGIAALPDMQLLTVLLVNVSKLAVTAAFCLIYLHTSEIFPTVVRSIALGLTVTFSRIGGIISPFASMYLAADEYRNGTLNIFGVMAVTAGLLTMLLPETTYKTLPETLDEGEAFGKPIRVFERVRKPAPSEYGEKQQLHV